MCEAFAGGGKAVSFLLPSVLLSDELCCPESLFERRKSRAGVPVFGRDDEGGDAEPTTPRKRGTQSENGTPRTQRKSTRTVAIARGIEREKERKEIEKKRALRGPKKRTPVSTHTWTQDELLAEAKYTELYPLFSFFILGREFIKRPCK